MTSTEAASVNKPIPRRAVIAVVIGNWLEFYDFLVYSFFSVMIAGAFFPFHSDFQNLLAALATFGVGFFTRPLGAAIIGAYADRAGRRAAMTLTLMLMAVGSAMVAFTLGYAQIGIAAPILLVLARLIQGFSCGGEVGPATSYLYEAASPARRASATSWQTTSQQLAIILGGLIGAGLAAGLSKADLYSWGWRVPFLAGILIAPIGIYIRRQLPDTIEKHEAHVSVSAVLANLARGHSRAVFFGILIICGGTISTYVFNYMTTYAITNLKLSPTVGSVITLTGAVAAIVGNAVGAFVDRFGRKPMLVLARSVFVALLYPAFVAMTAHGAPVWIIVAINMGLNFMFYLGVGAIYAFLSEAFPKAVRSSGLSILYASSVAIFGGTTQFVVAWLIQTTNNPLMPAFYQIAANLVTIVGLVCLIPYTDKLERR